MPYPKCNPLEHGHMFSLLDSFFSLHFQRDQVAFYPPRSVLNGFFLLIVGGNLDHHAFSTLQCPTQSHSYPEEPPAPQVQPAWCPRGKPMAG